LMVCLGNICRSPTAEAVFQALIDRRGLGDEIEVDSCGTGGGSAGWYKDGGFSYHEGDAADSRMTAVAKERGVKLTSRSRPLTPEDLNTFDYIMAMDYDNVTAIFRAADYWSTSGKEVPPRSEVEGKVRRMATYCTKTKEEVVPDPYYGGKAGFELVLDLLEDACTGLIDEIVAKRK